MEEKRILKYMENKQRIEEVQKVISEKFGVSLLTALKIIENNESLRCISPQEFSAVIDLLKTRYYIDNNELINLTKELNFAKKHLACEVLQEKEQILYRECNVSPLQFGMILRENKRMYISDPEKLVEFISVLKIDVGLNPRFIKNIFTRSAIYDRYNANNVGTDMNWKIRYLTEYGITEDMLSENPAILGTGFRNIDAKLKLALINGVTLEEFLVDKHYFSPANIYAKYKAKEMGIIDIETPYTSEKNLKIKTGFSTADLMKEFVWDGKAYREINQQFVDLFPEQAPVINQKYHEISNEIKSAINEAQNQQVADLYMQVKDAKENDRLTQDKESVQKETPQVEPTVVAPVKERTEEDKLQMKARRLLGLDDFGLSVLYSGLKIKKPTEAVVKHIAYNMQLLSEYGFKKEDILARPSVLKVDPNKLEVRIKLARINKRTDLQFLTKDYRCSEETIYARTCGVKIMKPSHSLYVYDSEEKFSRNFGSSTANLARLCKGADEGMKMIDKLYQEVIEGENNLEGEQD